MAPPSVFSYLDHRDFLRDWIAYRKRSTPRYSYAMFARAGGCSKAAIANVVSGARMPRPQTLDAISLAMGLGPEERNYLGLIVEHAAAPDVRTRRAVLDRMMASERYRQVRQAESYSDLDMFRYFEHWYVPAIRELATLPGFRSDPEWVAGALRPPIRVDEAVAALDTLFDLGLLERRQDGGVDVSEPRLRTRPEALQRAANHFHKVAIPELLRKLDSDLAPEQHVMAATLCVAPDTVDECKARIGNLVEQLATLADDKAVAGPHRVYQLAVQFVPVSEPVE